MRQVLKSLLQGWAQGHRVLRACSCFHSVCATVSTLRFMQSSHLYMYNSTKQQGKLSAWCVLRGSGCLACWVGGRFRVLLALRPAQAGSSQRKSPQNQS